MTDDDKAAPPKLPRWHEDLPRLPGAIKSFPEDFVVEEIPAYEPTGEGDHLFLWIEKRDLSGEQLLKQLARQLDIPQNDIGCAGIKDRFAVTRQWISVPARSESKLANVSAEQCRILKAARHGNKLRTGHLKGNRFSIVVRIPKPGSFSSRASFLDAEIESPADQSVRRAFETAQQWVSRLQAKGFPNYYGEQRFGREGDTAALGFDLLAGRKSPKDIPYARRKFLLRLSLSAAQSELFNQVLAARLADGLVDTVLAGDVMEVVASGGKFVVEDPATEQPRCDRYETVVTGPMFGPKMKLPTGVPAEREARILAEAGLTMDQFRGFGDLLSGTRRALVVRPGEITVQPIDEGLRFEFTLPPGVYATTLLAEMLSTKFLASGAA